MLGGRPRALLSNRSSQLWLGRHHASETCLSPKECVTLHIPDKCTDLEWGSINSMAHVVRLTDCFRRLGRAKPWEPPIIPPTIASSAVTLANSGVSSRNGDSRCSLFSGSQKSVLRNVKKKRIPSPVLLKGELAGGPALRVIIYNYAREMHTPVHTLISS